VLKTFESLKKSIDNDTLGLADLIAEEADDSFIRESSKKLSASLLLSERDIQVSNLPHDYPQSVENTNDTSIVYRQKRAKELNTCMNKLKSGKVGVAADELLPAFKDYNRMGITLESQERYLQECVMKK
jgi:hypothetical protein